MTRTAGGWRGRTRTRAVVDWEVADLRDESAYPGSFGVSVNRWHTADRVLRNNLTSYDAWYVALAEALGCPLATLDKRLVRAAGPTCKCVTLSWAPRASFQRLHDGAPPDDQRDRRDGSAAVDHGITTAIGIVSIKQSHGQTSSSNVAYTVRPDANVPTTSASIRKLNSARSIRSLNIDGSSPSRRA